MARFAEAGMGLALLPDDLRTPELQRLVSVPDVGTNSLWLLTHPEMRKVEKIRALMQHLHQCFSEESQLNSD